MDAAKGRARSGSEMRQKQHRVTIRLAASEQAELAAAAERAGQTVGAYIRSRVLAAPITRARRRPAVEVVALTRLQGEMNKVGSNIHQMLRRLNFGETPAGDEVRAAFAGYREVIAAILTTLGRGPR
jgi:hypothetical protein